MKKEYRFRKRKEKGNVFYVMFASCPGRWFSSHTANRDEAVIWAESHKYSAFSAPAKDITFGEFANGFFNGDPHGWRNRMEKKKKRYQEIWYTYNQGRLDSYIIPAFGRQLLVSITTRQIDNWFIELTSVRDKGKPLADNTKNKILGTLNIILQEAEDQQLIKQNPARFVEGITEEHEKRAIFTKEEIINFFPLDIEKCIEIWGSLSWYLYFRILAVCGLRPGEVAALNWEDYYPEHHGIVVRNSIDHRGNLKGLKTEKKGKKEKAGYLDDKTVSELNRYRKECGNPKRGIIFPGKRSDVIKPESALKHLRLCAPVAGVTLDRRTLYSFRHTFDTELLRKLDRDTVNDLMGHTAYRKEYDHRTGEEILEQRKGVREIINGSF